MTHFFASLANFVVFRLAKRTVNDQAKLFSTKWRECYLCVP